MPRRSRRTRDGSEGRHERRAAVVREQEARGLEHRSRARVGPRLAHPRMDRRQEHVEEAAPCEGAVRTGGGMSKSQPALPVAWKTSPYASEKSRPFKWMAYPITLARPRPPKIVPSRSGMSMRVQPSCCASREPVVGTIVPTSPGECTRNHGGPSSPARETALTSARWTRLQAACCRGTCR